MSSQYFEHLIQHSETALLSRYFVDSSGWNILWKCTFVHWSPWHSIYVFVALLVSGSLICSTFNQTWRIGVSQFTIQFVEKIMPRKSWKEPPSKIAHFFPSTIAAKTTQTEKFLFQNVAYRPTVYKAGEGANKKVENWNDVMQSHVNRKVGSSSWCGTIW